MESNIIINNLKKTFADLLDAVSEGHLDALEVHIGIKRFDKLYKEACAIIQDEAIDEANKHGGKEIKIFGATVTKKNAAGKWNWDKVTVITELDKNLKEKKKAMQGLVKAKQKEWIEQDSGEICPLPTYMEGPSTIAISLDKD